jgi:hypothetical protein
MQIEMVDRIINEIDFSNYKKQKTVKPGLGVMLLLVRLQKLKKNMRSMYSFGKYVSSKNILSNYNYAKEIYLLYYIYNACI